MLSLADRCGASVCRVPQRWRAMVNGSRASTALAVPLGLHRQCNGTHRRDSASVATRDPVNDWEKPTFFPPDQNTFPGYLTEFLNGTCRQPEAFPLRCQILAWWQIEWLERFAIYLLQIALQECRLPGRVDFPDPLALGT